MISFESRIDLDVSLEDLSKEICKSYGLGGFEDYKLIEIGFEDFNFILKTQNGRFVVKIFSNLRSDEDCVALASRAVIANENGFSVPKIYKTLQGQIVFEIKPKNVKYRLIVMEYIDGKDFFSLDIMPDMEELKFIGEQLAILNKIQYKPPFIYDLWAIINFLKEFDKNKHLLDIEERSRLERVAKELEGCDFSKLKYGFVHGDIIVTNILKDRFDKIHFFDFSVSNYQPRIVELAVSIGDFCIDLNDLEESKKRTIKFLKAYESVSKLDEYEKDCLKIFLKVHQATTILNSMREKVKENNDSVENQEFLDKGRKGLRLVMEENLFE